MEIYWVNGQYQEDERIFDSQFEVYEWTDLVWSFQNKSCFFKGPLLARVLFLFTKDLVISFICLEKFKEIPSC